MGHQQHRQAAPRRLVEDEALEFAAQRVVELGEGLVEQQRLRRGDQRSHQRRRGRAVRPTVSPDRDPQSPRAPPRRAPLRRARAERPARALSGRGRTRRWRRPRDAETSRSSWNSTPIPRRSGGSAVTSQPSTITRPRGGKRRIEMAADIGEQRRLACTARPHDRRRAARLDAKGEIAHQRARAYRDGDDVDFERMRGHGDSIWRRFA